jgi:hypothetical protein
MKLASFVEIDTNEIKLMAWQCTLQPQSDLLVTVTVSVYKHIEITLVGTIVIVIKRRG